MRRRPASFRIFEGEKEGSGEESKEDEAKVSIVRFSNRDIYIINNIRA